MEQKGTKILISEVTLQGIGMLIGWNAMLSSLDWYNSKFPNNNPGFWLPFLNFLPTLIFQPLSILYGHLWTFNVRIITSYVIVGVILVCTPIIVELTSESLGFIIICVTTVVNGAVNAVSQSGLAGLMGPMPGQYMNALMLGNGLSGLCVSALRLLCLAIFTQNSEGYLHSTELYFAIAGFICVLCIITQLHLMKHPLIIESISKTHCKEAVGKLISPSNEMDSFRNSSGFNTHEKKQVSYAELFKKIWQYLFLIWLNYVITFGVLSHVALATTANGIYYPVFTTLLILVFNFFDVIGRYTPMIVLMKGITLWVFTLARFIFWASFILIASDDPRVPPGWLFNGTWFKFVNMALYAFTNGFGSTCLMISGPLHAPEVSKDKAGYIMITGLMTGIFCGQLLSFAFLNVGHIPT